MARRRWMVCALLQLGVFVLSAAQCGGPSPVAPTSGVSPTAAPTSTHPEGTLTVIFPTETTKLVGGQSVRVTVLLVDRAGQPIEGATVRAELRAPDGDVFAALACVDKGQGRYLADYVRLPLRGTGGIWRVVARAQGNAYAEQTFQGLPSYSERLESQYGFWIEMPDFFSHGEWGFSGMLAGLHRADVSYEDGGGYVILSNYHYNPVSDVAVGLDVHWRRAEFPVDEAAAIAHMRSLARLNRQDPDIPSAILTVQAVAFQGRPAWCVTGRWRHAYKALPAASCPVEWLIFRCPGSEWLWTVVISADDAGYMDDLRALRETFECAAQTTEVVR